MSILLNSKKAQLTLSLSTFHLKGPADIRSSLMYLMTLFPRKLFNDTLPQIVIKHQLYSMHSCKTWVDKELVSVRLFD